MGHKLSGKGIDLTKDKVDAVVHAREPENAVEVREFPWAHKCLRAFHSKCCYSGRAVVASDKEHRSTQISIVFEAVKHYLHRAKTLRFCDPKQTRQVITDASPVGLGALLVQGQEEDPRVIFYASWSLSSVEWLYSQTERDAVALVWSCQSLYPYIYSTMFELVTDHKPIQFIYVSRSKPSASVERCALWLQLYEYDLRNIPRTKNIADSLPSGLLKVEEDAEGGAETDGYVRAISITATPRVMTTCEVEKASTEDQELEEVHHCLGTRKRREFSQPLYAAVSGEICAIGKLSLRGTRIIIPNKLRPQVLALAIEGQLGILAI